MTSAPSAWARAPSARVRASWKGSVTSTPLYLGHTRLQWPARVRSAYGVWRRGNNGSARYRHGTQDHVGWAAPGTAVACLCRCVRREVAVDCGWLDVLGGTVEGL